LLLLNSERENFEKLMTEFGLLGGCCSFT